MLLTLLREFFKASTTHSNDGISFKRKKVSALDKGSGDLFSHGVLSPD
jgi:hypothetical protein